MTSLASQAIQVAPDHWMEQAYWISQVAAAVFQFALLSAAVVAAFFAYRQIKAFELFELLKYLEKPDVRIARRTLYFKLKNATAKEWWTDDSELEEAAVTICAAFSVVGYFATGRTRRRFVYHWANVICWTHEALEPYLAHRRKEVPYFSEGYTQLYRSAKPIHMRRGQTGSIPN